MIHGFLGALVSGAVTHPRNVISSLSVIAALLLPTAPSPTADKPASWVSCGGLSLTPSPGLGGLVYLIFSFIWAERAAALARCSAGQRGGLHTLQNALVPVMCVKYPWCSCRVQPSRVPTDPMCICGCQWCREVLFYGVLSCAMEL